MRWALLFVALLGCGRIGFDPLALAGDDTTGDARAAADGASSDGVAGGGPQLVDSGHMESAVASQLGVSLSNPLQPGDVILVSVGFRDATANITTVTDSAGITLAREAQTNRSNGAVSNECMVGIAAAAAPNHMVNVGFVPAANQPSVRVLVYRGVGTSQAIQPQSSGGANIQAMSATTVAFMVGTKIVGTNTADRAATVGNGQLLMTTTFNDIVEERVATTTGIQNVTGTLASAGNWVMEAIALPPP